MAKVSPLPPTTPGAKTKLLDTLQSAIDWRTNNTGIPPLNKNISLDTLQRLQGAGGMKAAAGKVLDGVTVSDGTKAELLKIANAAGLDPAKHAEMIQKYKAAYDACGIDAANHDPAYADEKAKALAKSLEAVRDYIDKNAVAASLPPTNLFTSLTENIKEAFRNPSIEIASGNPGMMSDMGGYLPRQDGIFAAAGQHLQHFAKATQEAVASTMHHASDAVGHAWNSEPVQGALHSSATYTAVSLLATGAGVRLSTVLKAREAEAIPTDPPKNLGERALRMTNAAGEIARDFFTKDVGGKEAYLQQLNKAPTKLALARAALIPTFPPVAIAAAAVGVSSLAARVVHAATQGSIKATEAKLAHADAPQRHKLERHQQRLEKVAAASQYVADMQYINDATAFAAKKAEPLLSTAKQAIKETTANVQQTMHHVQQTMAGLWQGMTNRFKMA